MLREIGVIDRDAKPADENALLDIRGLKTHFATDEGVVQAVDGVDLRVDRGETVCVVGESGCGKTVTALSVLKLIAMPPGRIVAGQILWQGRDIVPLPAEEMNRIRAPASRMTLMASTWRSRLSIITVTSSTPVPFSLAIMRSVSSA